MEALEQGRRYKLTGLISRLEAATSRLEDIASSSQSLDADKPAHGTSAAAVSRAASTNGETHSSTPTPKPAPIPTPTPPAAPELPKSIEDFDHMVKEDVTPFQNSSARMGGPVADAVRYLSSVSSVEVH